MAQKKQHRWACPRCGGGALAPSRPRMDDVRRYCLPCSETTGRLVERTCPVRDAAATRRKERSAARQADQRARDAAIRAEYPWRLDRVFRAACRLAAWDGALPDPPVFVLRRSPSCVLSTGRAWAGGRGRVVITAGLDEADARAVVLHELAHVAAGVAHGHDGRWRGLFLAAAAEAFACEVPVKGIGRYGVHAAATLAAREWLRANPQVPPAPVPPQDHSPAGHCIGEGCGCPCSRCFAHRRNAE